MPLPHHHRVPVVPYLLLLHVRSLVGTYLGRHCLVGGTTYLLDDNVSVTRPRVCPLPSSSSSNANCSIHVSSRRTRHRRTKRAAQTAGNKPPALFPVPRQVSRLPTQYQVRIHPVLKREQIRRCTRPFVLILCKSKCCKPSHRRETQLHHNTLTAATVSRLWPRLTCPGAPRPTNLAPTDDCIPASALLAPTPVATCPTWYGEERGRAALMLRVASVFEASYPPTGLSRDAHAPPWANQSSSNPAHAEEAWPCDARCMYCIRLASRYICTSNCKAPWVHVRTNR